MRFYVIKRLLNLNLKKTLKNLSNMKNKLILLICAFCLFSACSGKRTGYKSKLNVKTSANAAASSLAFDRYENVLFNLDTTDFQSQLKKVQPNYLPFIGGDLDNMAAVNYLKSFACDTFIISLYQKVQSYYPNLNTVEKEINTVLDHFNYYYPDVKLPDKVYTYVSGIDYQTPPIMLSGDNILVSLDYYLSNDSVYDQIGMPRYRSMRTTPDYISKDLALAMFFKHVYKQRKQTDLLNEMISVGKQLYFIEAMNPEIPDKVLLGYSDQQMNWTFQNEGALWSHIIGNNLLYTAGLDMYQRFFADGPFTQEFSQEAPSRLGEFVGLQIVRSYMSNNDVTLQQLMDDMDSQQIFQKAMYKPKE
jgi:hypothetical protein